MRVFRWVSPFVHEAEGAAGGTGGGEGAAEGEKPSAAPEGVVPEPPKQETGGRPGWLPEGFEKPEDLAAAYTTLHGQQAGIRDTIRQEMLAGRPEKPEGYEFRVDPKALGLPDGFEVVPPKADDPVLTEARSLMHELGATPAQWDRLTGAFIKAQASTMPNIAAERAKLGEGAAQRIADADAWLARNLDKAQYDALSGAITTADAVLAIESLVRQAGKGRGAPAGGAGGAGGGNQVTADEARAALNHPDYWHETKGAELRQKVQAFHATGQKLTR